MSACYSRVDPPARLAGIVDSIWVQEAPADTATEPTPTTVLPTGSPELLVYYGDPFVEETTDGDQRHPRAVFGGQRSRAVRVRATGRTGILVVRFLPWGAAPVAGVPMGLLRNRFVPLEELFGAVEASSLVERVDAGRSPAERAQPAIELLLRRLDPDRVDPAIARAAIEIKRQDPALTQLASRFGIGARQLRRRFQDRIGIGPKSFSGLLRLQEAIWHRRQGAEWSDVARTCGYHDQAHLIKAWRAILEAPPARALDRRDETPLGRYFRDGRGLGDFYNTTYL